MGGLGGESRQKEVGVPSAVAILAIMNQRMTESAQKSPNHKMVKGRVQTWAGTHRYTKGETERTKDPEWVIWVSMGSGSGVCSVI